jgi:hypothetical protein
MRQFTLLICLVLAISCPITARKDKTQKTLEHYLAREPNRLGLISNETFIRSMFDLFRNQHPSRLQASDNDTKRYQAFQGRLIDAVKSDNKTNRTFTVGLNQFSDWTIPELVILRGNLPPSTARRSSFITMGAFSGETAKTSGTKTSSAASAATFDYTARVSAVNPSIPIIGPVKDQGQCGSCYAFAFITLLEAQSAFQNGQSVSMSEQQIVDCSPEDSGCDGGYMDSSFNYIQSYNWYVDSESTYPYVAVANNCSATTTGGWSTGTLVYRNLPSGNVTAMEQALINYGPLWISLYVGSDCSGSAASSCPVTPQAASEIMNTFQGYTSGIFQASGCTTSVDNNNHAMAIVGYGYDSVLKLNYWKVRNSWGDEWGEDGYVRILQGVNMCNVESDAYFVAKPVS